MTNDYCMNKIKLTLILSYKSVKNIHKFFDCSQLKYFLVKFANNSGNKYF